MLVEIDGRLINTAKDFHRTMAAKLDFGLYYGHNLDALWEHGWDERFEFELR